MAEKGGYITVMRKDINEHNEDQSDDAGMSHQPTITVTASLSPLDESGTDSDSEPSPRVADVHVDDACEGLDSMVASLGSVQEIVECIRVAQNCCR